MPPAHSPHRLTKRDRAHALLREAVLLRRIPRGQRVREAEWSRRLDVNRSAVREACARLCGEGLLVEGPKGGYFMPAPGPDDIADALEVRVMLEAGAVERICRLGLTQPRHVRPLNEACEDLAWLLRKGYAAGWRESDRRFHEALVAAADSQRLKALYRYVSPADAECQICNTDAWRAVVQLILDEHRAVLAALRQGHVLEAQRLLQVHLTQMQAAAATPA